MMNKIYKHVLVASLLMMGGTAMAQTLNSAYFTDDYKFRHDMNPAFENKQNYITIPALGNINVNLPGNFGYQDKTEYVVTPNTQHDDYDPEDIRRRYLTDSVPINSDD